MTLYFKCSSCKTENSFKSDATTRIELAMEKGNTYIAKCLTCNKTNTYQINDIYAKASKPLSIIAALIFIVGILFGLFAVAKMFIELKIVIGIFAAGCGLLIPIWIFSTIKKEDRLRVKTFNHSYVKEKK